MKLDINDDLIIGYINNTISESDRIAIEREMQYNSDVVKRYEYLKNAINPISTGKNADMKEKGKLSKGKSDQKQVDTPIDDSASKRQFVIGMLLFLIVLVFVFVNIQYSDSSISNNAMNDEGMKNYGFSIKPVEGTTIGTYQNAYALYHKRQYSASYMLLNRIKSTTSTYQEAQYGMAIISFREGQFEETIRITSLLLLDECLIKDKVGFLRLNALIQREGYDPKYIEQYLTTNPNNHYLRKTEKLLEKMEAPIRSFVFI